MDNFYPSTSYTYILQSIQEVIIINTLMTRKLKYIKSF